MSDIYIPGVSSRFDTAKMIEGLMKIERVPRDRLEKEIEDLQTQKGAWQDIGTRMVNLRESARGLYSYQNPFSERVVSSTQEDAITGTAERNADEREYRIEVKQAASADRFASKPLDKELQIPAGEYGFSVGEETVTISFKGGSLKDFATAVERRGKGLVSASTIQAMPTTTTLIVEAKKTGSDARLAFTGDSEKLALDLGIASRVDTKERNFSLQASSLRPLAGALDRTLVSAADGELAVKAGGSALVPVSPSVAASGRLTLELELSSTRKPDDGTAQPGPPQGPTVPGAGALDFAGVTLENDPSVVPLPAWNAPPVPPRRDDPQVLSLVFADGKRVELPAIPENGDWTKLSFRIADYGKELTGIALENRNTHRDVAIRNVRIYDPDAKGGLKPSSPISTAGDAVLNMDGIEVVRHTNEIDDLVPNVTFTVRRPSDGQATVSVEPDRKAAKDAIIALVGNYNRLVAEVNVLTRNDDKIVQELSYLQDDERDAMKKKLGLFQGDITLNQFKNSLQRALGSPYTTAADRSLALLSQVGISSDASKPGSGSGVDKSRLRGYLEIDEKALDAALQKNIAAVQQLFGRDTDGDLVMDTGAAVAADTLLKPYVETGGLLTLKTGGIDSKISQDKTRMATLDRQLADKEAEYKRKYGEMEGALDRMEATSSSIDNFTQQNSSK